MLSLVVANVRRRRARVLLSAVGIAVGVATIVALLALTAGLQRTASELVDLGEGDLGLFQRGVADPTASVLPTSLADRLEELPAVERATPLQLLVDAIPGQPGAIAFGVRPDSYVAERLTILRGEQAGRGEVLLGEELADELAAGIGDTVTVKGRPLRVAGIYHSPVAFQNAGAVLPLEQAQALAGRPGEATTIAVQLPPDVSEDAARQAIAAELPSLQIIGDPGEAARAGANAQLIRQAVLVIAALALVVGAIGVTNTMVMSVMERERELGLLATVGWGRRRIAGLVLGEGLAVSILGSALGLALGAAAAELLVRAFDVGAFVSPVITAWGLGRGALVGLAIGVLGGLYPAWRVTRISPAQVLARG